MEHVKAQGDTTAGKCRSTPERTESPSLSEVSPPVVRLKSLTLFDFDHVTFPPSARLARRAISPSPSFTRHASTPKLVSFHPRCHTVDSLPFTAKFPISSYPADRPSPSYHAAHVVMSRAAPRKSGIGPDHIYVWEGILLYIEWTNPLFRTFPLSPFALDLPLPILETPLLLRPFYHFGHRTSYTLIV